MYSIRERTTAKAGVAVRGLVELISELSACASAEEVVLFHFGTAARLFTVVLHERGSTMVGCVSLPRRRTMGIKHQCPDR